MRSPLTFRGVFVAMAFAILLGTLVGGLLGFAAASIAPHFFARILAWGGPGPRGTATVLAAFAGGLLGLGLGIFALIMQTIARAPGTIAASVQEAIMQTIKQVPDTIAASMQTVREIRRPGAARTGDPPTPTEEGPDHDPSERTA